MAQTITIKRGLKADLPVLEPLEIGYCTDTREVFIGSANGNIPIVEALTGAIIVALINAGEDKINDANLSANVADAVNKKHSHSNLSILANIQEAFTTALKTKLDGIASGATKVEGSTTNGNIKIDGVEKTVYTHPGSGTNPHGTTKSDVGLGNVENKSSVTIRGELTSSNVTTALGYTPIGGNNIPVASSDTLGLIKVGANLVITEDGTLNANDNPASFIRKQERFTTDGSTTTFNLAKGTYKPNTGTMTWFLNGDKQDDRALTETSSTSVTIPTGLPSGLDIMFEYFEIISANPFPNHASEHLSIGADPIADATISQDGLMSAIDKTKLNGIEDGANKYIHPTTHPATMITTDSTHEFVEDGDISNWNDANSKKHTHNNLSILQAITQTLIDTWNTVSNKSDVGHKHIKADITDFPTSMPASGGNADTLDNIDSTGFFKTGTAIPANADLNNYTTEGNYYCVLTATAQTISNTPVKEAFGLSVYKTNGWMQIWRHYGSNLIFLRIYYNNAWTSWEQIAKTSDIPTTLPANGGTSASCSGNSATATKLATARTITLSGDASGSTSFDGSSNVTLTLTVADDSHNHVISNVDGLQTALDAKAPIASPTFTGTPKSVTPATADNSTNIATTAFVKAQGYITAAGSGAKIAVSSSAPTSPQPGDFWYKV